ncbi:MAG TPA: hypothetical protein VHP58_05940 [Alphaproteobacteria bacterium]|nr:hypothetical protein [Alphaproteobacteria bacterium]
MARLDTLLNGETLFKYLGVPEVPPPRSVSAATVVDPDTDEVVESPVSFKVLPNGEIVASADIYWGARPGPRFVIQDWMIPVLWYRLIRNRAPWRVTSPMNAVIGIGLILAMLGYTLTPH